MFHANERSSGYLWRPCTNKLLPLPATCSTLPLASPCKPRLQAHPAASPRWLPTYSCLSCCAHGWNNDWAVSTHTGSAAATSASTSSSAPFGASLSLTCALAYVRSSDTFMYISEVLTSPPLPLLPNLMQRHFHAVPPHMGAGKDNRPFSRPHFSTWRYITLLF
jgi:hypothetical protein